MNKRENRKWGICLGKYFGTDGFRGEAGEVLTARHAFKIGKFLAWYYGQGGHRVRGVIGKDTRRSSYMLEYAIASGLASAGADVYMLHVTTTPSVSFVAKSEDFDFGIMISASHNPYYDNGIKIVNSKGEKTDEAVTDKIEEYLDGTTEEIPYAKGAEIGEIVDHFAGRNRYIGYLISVSRSSFKGLKIGLDCANGGAWMLAKSVFDALGAKTYTINNAPNGMNINKGAGSTHIEALCRHVKENNLDMGFAFDGDADRCIAVDEQGREVNGDSILYILATAMKGAGELKSNTVVTTVMSNLGLYRALEDSGIEYVKTAVGDRFVYEEMVKMGYELGGEQSGHIIMSKYATTGDGILTAIKVTEAVIEAKATLSELSAPVVMLPQITRNVPVVSKDAVMENKEVKACVEAIERELGRGGRILLRKSGTEPVIRIMVEAQSEKECCDYIERVLSVIAKEGLNR